MILIYNKYLLYQTNKSVSLDCKERQRMLQFCLIFLEIRRLHQISSTSYSKFDCFSDPQKGYSVCLPLRCVWKDFCNEVSINFSQFQMKKCFILFNLKSKHEYCCITIFIEFHCVSTNDLVFIESCPGVTLCNTWRPTRPGPRLPVSSAVKN